jgi:hypothetical protein
MKETGIPPFRHEARQPRQLRLMGILLADVVPVLTFDYRDPVCGRRYIRMAGSKSDARQCVATFGYDEMDQIQPCQNSSRWDGRRSRESHDGKCEIARWEMKLSMM